ncbi:MAG TPA: hypothetical protein PLR12_01450 [Clostridia bacterium]|nr:hypothetical protein [Clostridia bacterium]
MTSEQLAGLRLEDALAILKQEGITPEVVISGPPRPPQRADGRSLRVVRYVNNQLLCSHFRDAMPEET